ncbi:ORF6N domain-containing protein [candidate division WOR-3 bacterium]|nr:ORF6N domain-containing protein [candidate division WOR-3 bacterium]
MSGPTRKRKDGYLVPLREVQGAIKFIRGQHVVLDEDLAKLYGVETRVLVQAVKRNADRFPDDFMFQLDADEFRSLRAQADSAGRGGRRHPPHAFTEHGALMVAGVLNSPQAVEASVFVVRAFVRMRRLLATRRELAQKLGELEQRIVRHDASIAALFDAVRKLMQLPDKPGLPG